MYERSIVEVLRTRMKEPLGLMQVLVGPRQTGKSTALKQASTGLDIPLHSVSADFADADWLRVEWQQSRNIVAAQGEAILMVDEVQKIEDVDKRQGVQYADARMRFAGVAQR